MDSIASIAFKDFHHLNVLDLLPPINSSSWYVSNFFMSSTIFSKGLNLIILGTWILIKFENCDLRNHFKLNFPQLVIKIYPIWPFNKYAYLTTHNAFAIDAYPSRTGIPRLAVTNQEDSVTQQLKNGVRSLMLDTYDFKRDVWLCHSFGGHCYDYTAFGPAVETLKEIEAFLSSNPSEIVTIILEDYVKAPKGLTKVFTASGLMKYWFPLVKMPKNGQDWPLVSDMVKSNHRLLVFTSVRSKEQSEGIAYQWNYMVENHYGDSGMHAGKCPNRAESSSLKDKSKSLVLVNYFLTIPMKELTCIDNSGELMDMVNTCYSAAGNRWANFVAVNYYKRSEGGGSFQAVDTLNGKLMCGCKDIHACLGGSSSAGCSAQIILQ